MRTFLNQYKKVFFSKTISPREKLRWFLESVDKITSDLWNFRSKLFKIKILLVVPFLEILSLWRLVQVNKICWSSNFYYFIIMGPPQKLVFNDVLPPLIIIFFERYDLKEFFGIIGFSKYAFLTEFELLAYFDNNHSAVLLPKFLIIKISSSWKLEIAPNPHRIVKISIKLENIYHWGPQ